MLLRLDQTACHPVLFRVERILGVPVSIALCGKEPKDIC